MQSLRIAAICLLGPLAAQAPANPRPNVLPDPAAKLALVQSVCRVMAAVKTFTFQSSMTIDSQVTRMMRVNDKATVVRGTWGEDGLHATLHENAQEVVVHGRQMLARTAGGAWKRRSGKLSEGGSLPHLLNPEVLFRALGECPFEVLHADVGTLDDRPVEIITLRATADAARELTWSGALPEESLSGPSMLALLRANGGEAPKGDVEIDVALFVDPASKRVLRLRAQTYSRGVVRAGGAVFVAAGGGVVRAAAAEDEDEDAEPQGTKKGEPAAPALRDGLPVRSKPNADEWTVTRYEVSFADHGTAAAPALDAAARAMLGRPADNK